MLPKSLKGQVPYLEPAYNSRFNSIKQKQRRNLQTLAKPDQTDDEMMPYLPYQNQEDLVVHLKATAQKQAKLDFQMNINKKNYKAQPHTG